MLIIRQSQENALAEVFVADWLRNELIRLFPAQCAARGAAGLEQFIPSGVRRARRLGFNGDDYLPYLALEICLGENFLDAPENEWARTAMKEGPDRMQSLYRAAVFYFAELAEIEQRSAASAALELAAKQEEGGEETSVAQTDSLQEIDSTGESSHV